MNYLFLLSSLLLFTSCSSDDHQSIVDTNIEISVKSISGVDLLNPQNSNSFHEDDIKLFYLQNGKKTEVNNPNLSYPKGFLIFQHEDEYRLRIFSNTGIDLKSGKTEDFPLTFIEWKGTDTDTIKCSIDRKSNSIICNKVWFNDKLVWQAYETERFFEIIK